MGTVHLKVLDGALVAEEPVDAERAFRKYAPHVASICLRIVGRRDEVDDLVQDVFLHAHRGLRALVDAHAVRAWLSVVAVRVSRRRLKALRLARLLRLDDEPDFEAIAATGASTEERAEVARLYRALDQMPVGDRVAWVLHRVEGETLPRVAALCECSLATAKRRIARIQGRLDEVLR